MITVIRGAWLVDGEGGRGEVVIDGERITEVGSRVLVPPDARVVEASGGTLLPGLVDCHTHSFPGSPIQALALGVTTELDMFSSPEIAATLRASSARRAGMAEVRSAGTGAGAPGGYPAMLVESGVYPPYPTLTEPEEAAAFVRDRVAEGSDYLKIIIEDGQAYGQNLPCLRPEVVAALTLAAHEHGLLAVAHVSTRAATVTALEAGVDVLAHVFTDVPGDAKIGAAIAESGTTVVPTLVQFEGRDGGGLAEDPRIRPYLHPASLPGLAADRDQGRLENALATTRLIHRHGGTLLAGTDTPNPGTTAGASVHRELEFLVRAGLSPLAALAAATSEPARVFGLAGRGRIAPGQQADLLLVDGDPTSDITATRSVRAVWRRGERFDRDAYRAGLS
ncbi:amidohydrolase family protein [Amycolatopsis sp. NPDC000746]|uniref:amidohydrolase family protein n=1 Tax=Amycolatopsis sp. NPDC000746 TaxID=3154270 RepID=UPI003322EF7E